VKTASSASTRAMQNLVLINASSKVGEN